MSFEVADPTPETVAPARCCQGWRCQKLATWNRWAGWFCYEHAIRAGWLPGPVIRPGTQLILDGCKQTGLQ